MCFSNKKTVNELMSVTKSCILKYAKRKTKDILQIFFFLIWYLKLENGMLKMLRQYI